MFKNKHVYTCPDVIHMRNLGKRNNRIVFGTTLFLIAAGNVYGWYLTRKIDDNVTELKAVQND